MQELAFCPANDSQPGAQGPGYAQGVALVAKNHPMCAAPMSRRGPQS